MIRPIPTHTKPTPHRSGVTASIARSTGSFTELGVPLSGDRHTCTNSKEVFTLLLSLISRLHIINTCVTLCGQDTRSSKSSLSPSTGVFNVTTQQRDGATTRVPFTGRWDYTFFLPSLYYTLKVDQRFNTPAVIGGWAQFVSTAAATCTATGDCFLLFFFLVLPVPSYLFLHLANHRSPSLANCSPARLRPLRSLYIRRSTPRPPPTV